MSFHKLLLLCRAAAREADLSGFGKAILILPSAAGATHAKISAEVLWLLELNPGQVPCGSSRSDYEVDWHAYQIRAYGTNGWMCLKINDSVVAVTPSQPPSQGRLVT